MNLYVEELTIFQRKELRKIKVSGEVIKELDDELMKKLESLRKKNTFLKVMSKRKSSAN